MRPRLSSILAAADYEPIRDVPHAKAVADGEGCFTHPRAFVRAYTRAERVAVEEQIPKHPLLAHIHSGVWAAVRRPGAGTNGEATCGTRPQRAGTESDVWAQLQTSEAARPCRGVTHECGGLCMQLVLPSLLRR